MEYKYTIDINLQSVNIEQLAVEIYNELNKTVYKNSQLDIPDGSINFINTNINDNLIIKFNDELTNNEKIILDSIISNYEYNSNYSTTELTSVILTSNTHNYNIDNINKCEYLRLSSSKKVQFTGIVAPTYNQLIKICNIGNNQIEILNNNNNSLPENRILLGINKITMLPDTTLALYYDLQSSRWRINYTSNLV